MKKIIRIWIYPFAIMGVLLMLTNTCKKDELETPDLTTTDISNITLKSATSGGNITSDGGALITSRGVCWSTNPNPTISNSITIDGSGTGSFTSILTGLDTNTKYYVRAYASNRIGVSYGNELIFTTPKVTYTGYAVGAGGTILKTTNGGSTWSTFMSGINNDFNSVYFINANTGFVVGDEGHILKTTDGGINWSGLSTGTTNKLNSVYFTDPNTGYAVGDEGTILKTMDGGITFTATNPKHTDFYLASVYFANATIGYAVVGNSAYYILKTMNGGTTWTIIEIGGYGNLSSVCFTDANTGYAVGGFCTMRLPPTCNGIILSTNDGGLTWSINAVGKTTELSSVYFTDANTGYAVGRKGAILKTINGGTTWAALSSGTTAHLVSVYFTDSNTGYVVGGGGTIIKTVDGGATWTILMSGTTNNLNSVFFIKHKQDSSY